MKTTALRLYGKQDLRLETFELPEIREDEILATVVTNSICMSDYKAVLQGADHKRVPKDIAMKPIIIGHELCGTILTVGENLKDVFSAGMKYSIQPALNYPGRMSQAIGYSYHHVGGDASRIVIHRDVIEMNCVIPYSGSSFFKASLSEPVACIIAALKSQYHAKPHGYDHQMGIKVSGRVAILGGGGPMGLEFLDLLLHSKRKPGHIVLTDLSQSKLDRAAALFPPEEAAKAGVKVSYVDVSKRDANSELISLSDNKGYDDVFVLVPSATVVEQASLILGEDGCLNLFTGPTNQDFSASLNFYKIHYNRHHVIGSAGSTREDMLEALDMISDGVINPAIMITHIGGLDSAAEAIKTLPTIAGGKKLIYTGISMPLIALDDFKALGETDPLFRDLDAIVRRTNGVWSKEAEEYLLAHARPLDQ